MNEQHHDAHPEQKPELPAHLRTAVTTAVDHWLRWLAVWSPATQRTRSYVCRKCLGSPLADAAGLSEECPHQVKHALIMRLHRIIDREVDRYVETFLPALHRELEEDKLWKPRSYDPRSNMPPEAEGLDVDPLPEPDQPFLFTLEELAEADASQDPMLPRPPLTAEEKQQLRIEIQQADQASVAVGQAVCFAVAEHKGRIQNALHVFVEPQVQKLLDELSTHLFDPPTS